MPWRSREPSRDVIEARERLAAITRDDDRVGRLEQRTQRILRENNLAPTIMDALGMRRR
jgi:hypothetical protein